MIDKVFGGVICLNPWQVTAPSGGEFTVTLSPDAAPDDTNTLPILPSDPQPSGTLPANLGYLVMRVYLPQGGPSAVEMPANILHLSSFSVS